MDGDLRDLRVANLCKAELVTVTRVMVCWVVEVRRRAGRRRLTRRKVFMTFTVTDALGQG
jgi:hypothetical protein